MGVSVWKSSDERIHITYQGVELQFEDIYHFMDALEIWHEYALFHEMESPPTPDEVWHIFGKINRN